jgi:hypothetical protein
VIEGLGLLVVIALMSSLLVETTTWWLRAEATKGSVGLFVSRTNIYLYGGRLFSLIFAAGISFLIEISVSTQILIILFTLSFVFNSLVHVFVLNGGSLTYYILKVFSRFLRLPPPEIRVHHPQTKYFSRITVVTAASSFAFSMGLTLPYILASLVPDYRLSISSLAQIINSFGTLLLLFYVDQVLFSAVDDGTIRTKVIEYSRGRALGFSVASIVLAMTYALWPARG